MQNNKVGIPTVDIPPCKVKKFMKRENIVASGEVCDVLQGKNVDKKTDDNGESSAFFFFVFL